MFNLLKVEFYKLKKFQIGYIAVLFMAVLGFSYGKIIMGGSAFEAGDNAAIIFSYLVSDTSLVFLISIAAALFMGKDFSDRTIGNEIKLGYSRFHILLSKTVMVYILASLLHVIYIVSTILGFWVMRGFDTSLFSTQNALWLLTVLIQSAAVMSGVVLISFIVQKASEAIVLSTLYTAICCNILRNYVSAKIFTTSCFYFAQDSNPETLISAVISALFTMIVFLVTAAVIFHKADVK